MAGDRSDRGSDDADGNGGEVDFSTLTGEFYRGEMDRTASWRGRLDQTTNWAVVVVAAILTWAFSSPDNPHYVMLIGMFGVAAFLVMEAVRYREYDVWRNRIRTLQEGLYVDLFSTDRTVGTEWRDALAADLQRPSFHLSFRQALAHRLRRSYLALLLLLLAAWLARITVFETGEPWRETASIYVIPGEGVVAAVGVVYAALIAVAVLSARGSSVQEFQE